MNPWLRCLVIVLGCLYFLKKICLTDKRARYRGLLGITKDFPSIKSIKTQQGTGNQALEPRIKPITKSIPRI